MNLDPLNLRETPACKVHGRHVCLLCQESERLVAEVERLRAERDTLAERVRLERAVVEDAIKLLAELDAHWIEAPTHQLRDTVTMLKIRLDRIAALDAHYRKEQP